MSFRNNSSWEKGKTGGKNLIILHKSVQSHEIIRIFKKKKNQQTEDHGDSILTQLGQGWGREQDGTL